jgi:plasmid maintenance system antidote protein VapI
MINKPPFATAKKLIQSDNIGDITELLETIPKTTLANAMKTSPKRFNRLIENPRLFMFEDAYTLAEVIGVDTLKVLSIIHAECTKNKK